MSKLPSCEWQYGSHRILQSVTLDSWEVKEMVMASKVILRVKEKNQVNGKRCDHKGIKCFQCEGWGHQAYECLSIPLNGKGGGNRCLQPAPPSNTTRWRGARDTCKY